MIFDEMMQKAHRQAELERLRAGFEGCGCSDCQEYYRELDLTVYGERVKRVADIITIIEGKTGADNWQQYHNDGENRRINVPVNDRHGAKIKNDKGHGGNDSHVQAPDIIAPKKPRGRPRKTGDVSRWTRNRRAKHAVMAI